MKNFEIKKKVITTVAAILMIMLGASTVFAQYQHPASEPVGDSTQMQQELLKHDPDMKYDDEIPAEDISPEISSAIVESYPGHGILKVYQARDGSYKVKLEKGDEKVTAYYSVNGQLLNETASPQEQSQITGDGDVDYSREINENELPEMITNSLDEWYPEHEIEAYRGEDGSYKVKVKNQDEEVAVYYNSQGYFLRDEKMNW